MADSLGSAIHGWIADLASSVLHVLRQASLVMAAVSDPDTLGRKEKDHLPACVSYRGLSWPVVWAP